MMWYTSPSALKQTLVLVCSLLHHHHHHHHQVPGASYRYRIEGGGRHWHFRAPPALSPDAAFTFLGFGDMGDAVHPAAKSPG